MSAEKKKRVRKQYIFIALMMAIPLTRFVIGQSLNVNMFWMAFNDFAKGVDMPKFVGWENFEGVLRLFGEENSYREWIAVRNAFSQFLLILCVNAPIALTFAYLLYSKVPGYKWMRVVLYFPAVTSGVVLSLIFKSFMMSGPVDSIYNLLGIYDKLPAEGWLGPNTAWNTLLIFSVWTGFSGNMLFFLSAMNRVPTDLVEAAKIDGASRPRIFFSIILPCISSTVATILTLSVTGAFTWATPSLLFMDSTAGINNTGTVGLSILHYTKGNQYGIAAAYGVLLTLIAVPVTLGVRAIGKKLSKDVEF